MSLDLAAFRDRDGRKITELDVPEFGEDETLRVRMLSGTDMFQVTEFCKKHPLAFDKQARMLFVFAAIDDEGEPLFNTQTVGTIMSQPSAMVLRLSEEIQKFCGLSAGDGDTAKNDSRPTPT